MEVRFRQSWLGRLESDAKFDREFPGAVVSAYRNRMQTIRAAPDERVFGAMRSLRFEKLKGKRDHQYSMRLNDQFRLIIEFEGKAPDKVVAVVNIEDYH